MHLRGFSVLLLTFALLIPYPGNADQSGPSNTVGFWKTEVLHGYTQMSFPLLPEDKTVNNVLSDQLTGGVTPEESDQILRWDPVAGQFQMCWYNTDTETWEGDFDTLSEAESYWVFVRSSSPANQTIVTYGNVVETPSYDMGTMTPGYNAVGSVWASPAPIADSGLEGFEGGLYLFLSDLIMSYDAATGTYSYAWQDGNSTWQGNLTEFEPLKGYWIYVAPGHAGFNWPNYYQPNPVDGRGLLIHWNYPLPGVSTYQPEVVQPVGLPPMPSPDGSNMNQNTPGQATSAKGGAQ